MKKDYFDTSIMWDFTKAIMAFMSAGLLFYYAGTL